MFCIKEGVFVKKIIASILALIFCFTLCACDLSFDKSRDDGDKEKSEKLEKEILGVWEATDLGGFIAFEKGGTGKIGYDDESATRFNWEYNEKREKYTLSIPQNDVLSSSDDTLVINIDIKSVKSSSIRYIKAQGRYFFHTDGIGDKETFEITSESMYPTLCVGNVIVCDPIDSAATLKVGDIITYWTVINGERMLNTHRIVEIYISEGYFIFTTKADNNPVIDELTVHEKDIVGKFYDIIIK